MAWLAVPLVAKMLGLKRGGSVSGSMMPVKARGLGGLTSGIIAQRDWQGNIIPPNGFLQYARGGRPAMAKRGGRRRKVKAKARGG